MLINLLEKSGISLQQLQAEGDTTSHLVDPFAQSQAADTPAASAAPAEDQKPGA
jgi:hypothetical protein